MPRKSESLTVHLPKTLLLGIHAPYNRTKDIDSYFEEFINLARSNDVTYADVMFIKLREIDSAYFITKGKLDELKKFCDENNIEEVIISEALSAQQERNIDEFLHCRIFDRQQLILEIFEKSAHSAESKAQIALAMFQHRKSRLAGKGINMSQQKGGIGGRGPGETAKVKEMRHIEKAMLKLKSNIDRAQDIRTTQRKQRLTSGIAHICIIGYTNAGKSTLLNTLTKSNVLAEDKLFATLDTTTRELFIDGTKKGLITDTVGFIQQLPHHLVAAFKSTLSELQYADLLLQVIDLADDNWESHIQVVHEILEELGVDKPMIYVFNKIDKVDNLDNYFGPLAKYQPHVLVSAHSKEELKPLTDMLAQWTKGTDVTEIHNQPDNTQE